MIDPRSPVVAATRAALLAAATLVAAGAPALAGGDRRAEPARRVDPRRGQIDFIRGGLGPNLQPYTRQGPWGIDHRYPRLPLFHPPVPAGPGDCLYETGCFPWQRG